MQTNNQPFSLEQWAGNNRFKRFVISGWGVALISLLLFTPPIVYTRHRDEQSAHKVGIISRKTSDELKAKRLIDSEYEDSFIQSCKEHTLPKVGNDYEKMARTCGCEYESIALIALGHNERFADVVGDIANGRREDQSCEFVN